LPKKTTEIIIKGKNDYVIGVKKNQPALYNKIQTIMADKNKRSSWYAEIEINKGRTELRSITVSDNVEGISDQWIGLNQLISIHRIVNTKGNKTEETAYFISSKQSNAFSYNEGIRLHWSIENSLHYVKDVTLKEDASKIRTGYAPQNISTIKNISLNILRSNKYSNMTQAMRLIANDIPLIKSLIN
jgi:predicted transposase YbfD/YdcC